MVFNHPGHLPSLTPFDSETPVNQLLDDVLGGSDWHGLTYVPDVDDRVVGIEVNGGDDLRWYVQALRNGWHIGPIGAEDEHQREWSSSDDRKTVLLTRGRSPRDYYAALHAERSTVIAPDMVDGAPGTDAQYPKVLFWADGSSVQDPAATVLGSTSSSGGAHQLEVDASELPPGSQAVLVSSTLDAPLPIGTADPTGLLRTSTRVTSPGTGEDWWFVVICQPGVENCGTPGNHSVVTAPIWVHAAAASAPAVLDAVGAAPAAAGRSLPATGAPVAWPIAVAAAAGGLALLAVRRAAASYF